MTNGKPIVRKATKEDLSRYYSVDRLPSSVKALVAEIDGEIVGVCGVGYVNNTITAFSEFDDVLKKYPVLIVKSFDQFRELMRSMNAPVMATAADYEENSDKFLRKVGFVFLGTYGDERLYKWSHQR